MDTNRRPHVIIGASFGTKTPPQDDPVNKRLAEMCDFAALYFGIPAILQWEIARYSTADTQLVVRQETGEYLDTHKLMVEAQTFCFKQYYTRVILVAGATHAYRAERTAKKLGFEVVGTLTTSDIWDSQSEQWWTRGLLRNLSREIPACLYYKWRGWM